MCPSRQNLTSDKLKIEIRHRFYLICSLWKNRLVKHTFPQTRVIWINRGRRWWNRTSWNMGPFYSMGPSGCGDCIAKSAPALDCSKSDETGAHETPLIFTQKVSPINWIYRAWKSFYIIHKTDSQLWAFWIIKTGVIGYTGGQPVWSNASFSH